VTVHLVTVGNSVRKDFIRPRGGRARNPALVSHDDRLLDAGLLGVDTADRASVEVFLNRLGSGDPAARQAASKAVAVAEMLGTPTGGSGWPSTVSAESTGLVAVTDTHTVNGDDLVVLLSSDTSDGMLAAFWNGAFMLGGRLEGLSYLAGPTAVLASSSTPPGAHLPERGGVLVVRIGNLDMARHGQGNDAMSRLGELGRLVLEGIVDDEPVVVHLSGGYKATIPFMIGIAEGMRSIEVRGRTATVTAYVVHEDSFAEGGPPQKIRLPLRRFKETTVQTELAAFTDGKAKDLGRGDTLEGYAYEQAGRGWRLTEFGFGLLALVGCPQVAGW
jgi:hypothetical protein